MKFGQQKVLKPFGVAGGARCLYLISICVLFHLCHSSTTTNQQNLQGTWHSGDYNLTERMICTDGFDSSGRGIDELQSSNRVANISAQNGSHAYLPCIVRRLGSKSVSWIRKRDGYVLTSDKDTFIADRRFDALHAVASDTWTLHIRSVVADDAGLYECQVSSEPTTSLLFRLNVIVPQVEIKGSPEIYINSGSHQLELLCLLTNFLEEPPFIFWYYEDRWLVTDSVRDIETPSHSPAFMGIEREPGLKQHSEENEEQTENHAGRMVLQGDPQRTYGSAPTYGNMDASPLSTNSERGKPRRLVTAHRSRPMRNHNHRLPSVQSVKIFRTLPGTITSRLTIFHPTTLDSGKYQCRPSNWASASVALHVLDGEQEEPAAAVQSDDASCALSVKKHLRICIGVALVITTAISLQF